MLAREAGEYDEPMKKTSKKAKKPARKAAKRKSSARRKPIMRHSKEG
jgi:hypothetical protein